VVALRSAERERDRDRDRDVFDCCHACKSDRAQCVSAVQHSIPMSSSAVLVHCKLAGDRRKRGLEQRSVSDFVSAHCPPVGTGSMHVKCSVRDLMSVF